MFARISLKDIEEDKRTAELCSAAVEQDWSELKYVPEDKCTPELRKAAVEQYWRAVAYVPEDKRTLELCEVAVEQDWRALQYVPEDKRTPELCKAAVQQNWRAVEFVAEDKRTDELWLAAVQQDWRALGYVPVDKHTPELYKAAVQQHWVALQYIPEDKCTPELCKAAVQQDWRAVGYVPEDKRTDELWLAAVQQDWRAVEYIPEDKRTQELCKAAVQQHWLALQYVPEDKCTPELCKTAVQQDGDALEYVPVDKRTSELCEAAVQGHWSALQFVPGDKRTPELCKAAVQRYWRALQFVPVDKLTPELCKVAVQQDWNALLLFVPEDKRTDELWLATVQQDWRALRYVPKDKRTDELWLATVQQDWRALRYVPKDKHTDKLWLAAVQQDGSALQFVPEEFKGSIIQKLSVPTILANNYLARQYFPKDPDFTNEINQFLVSVKQIVVNNESEDHELRDIQLTYAQKNKNKTVVSIASNGKAKEGLYALLGDLKQMNKSNDIHLALVGHGSIVSKELAGLHFQEITRICADNPQIQHIHLLGCNVAKAKQPEKEREMVKAFASKLNEKAKLRYGLVSTLEAPSNNPDFQKKCLSFCKDNTLDGVYVLNKTASGYQLFSLKYDKEHETIKEKVKDIPAERFPQGIRNILFDQKKPISFPKQTGHLSPIRKKENPLQLEELASVRGLAYESTRFEKTHPKYKKDKGTYPFLAKIEADLLDLAPSFLKLLADEIQKDKNIKWDITLQGPTKALHVDTEHKDFKVTRTHLYPSDYHHSRFFSGKPNIEYKKLKDERKQEILHMKSMKEGNVQETEESRAKEIKVTIKK
jgi:Domain of unknown function (DUF4116)